MSFKRVSNYHELDTANSILFLPYKYCHLIYKLRREDQFLIHLPANPNSHTISKILYTIVFLLLSGLKDKKSFDN